MRRFPSFPMIVIALVCATTARAQAPGALGFDERLYGFAFAAAERSWTSGGDEARAWLDAARAGSAAYLSRWERDAAALYDDPSEFAEAAARLGAWIKADLAERFGAWLRDRFLGRGASVLRAKVAEGAARANRARLYLIDEQGRPSYDAAGDPVYRRELEGLAEDGEAWRGIAHGARDAAVEGYGAWLCERRAELLAFLPEGEREGLEAALGRASSSALERATRELDALLEREERLFVARRTSDSWSLRRKSDSEAASEIASRLLAEVGAACDASIRSLSARVEAAGGAADVAELSATGTAWLDAFKEQFDRGLASWREAEERFMIRRIEWEREAGAAYERGDRAWAEAYARLDSRRLAWEAEASSLLRSGEEAFARAGAELEANIARARAEFERDAAERNRASVERAEAWVDAYAEAGWAKRSAEEGLSYWLSRLGAPAPAADDPRLSAWLASELSSALAGGERERVLREAKDCLEAIEGCGARANEALERLAGLCGLELGSTGLGAAGEPTGFLNEYQIAVVRAKAVEGYWRRRVGIARAVAAYAEDLSSGRATAAESIARLGEARSLYEAAGRDYAAAEEALRSAGASVSTAREAAAAAMVALSAAGTALEAAAREYAELMGSFASGDGGARLRDEMVERYRELASAGGLSSERASPGEAAMAAAYYEAARRLGAAEALELSSEALRVAVRGESRHGAAGSPSLAELYRAARAVITPSDQSLGALSPGDYGLDEVDPAAPMIEALRRAMEAELGASGGPLERVEIRRRYGEAAALAAEAARLKAEAALNARLAGIALLGAKDLTGWYEGLPGPSGLSAEAAGLSSPGGVEAALALREADARRALLRARVALELEAVRSILGRPGGEAPGEAARSLVGLGLVDPPGAETAERTLAAIASALDACPGGDEAALRGALASLCAADPRAGAFIRGYGYFSIAGVDAGSLFCADEAGGLELARGLRESYARWSRASGAVEAARFARLASAIDAALGPLGLGAPPPASGGVSLPSASAVSDAIGLASDPSSAYAGFALRVDEAAALAPGWAARELSRWKEAIMACVAAGRRGAEGAGPASAAAASLEAERTRIAEIGAILAGLSSGGDAYAVALVGAAASEGLKPAEAGHLYALAAEAMARSLVAGAGPGLSVATAQERDATRTALGEAAALRFGAVDARLRGRAVGLSMDLLAAEAASKSGADPLGLSGFARGERLRELWARLDPATAHQVALGIYNDTARAAYRLGTTAFSELAALPEGARRSDLSAYAERALDGIDGEDARAAMARLLEIALGPSEGAWCLEAARARVEAAALASLAPAAAYRDGLRASFGSASGPAERMLAAAAASLSPDQAFFDWVVDALGLAEAGGLSVQAAAAFGLEAEAFLGLAGDYAAEAASFYAERLGGAGDADGLEAAALRVGDEPLASGRRLLAIAEAAARYAGEYSGPALDWALSALDGTAYEAEPDLALSLAARLEGRSDGDGSIAMRWAMARLAGELESLFARVRTSEARLGLTLAAEAFSAAEERAAAEGAPHWRLTLADPAISLALAEAGLHAPASSSWREAALADALVAARSASERVEAALGAWAAAVAERETAGGPGYADAAAFGAAIARFLADPTADYDPSDARPTPSALKEDLIRRRAALTGFDASLRATREALTRSAAAFSAAADPASLEARLVVLERRIGAAKEAQDRALAEYDSAETLYSLAGAAYDAAYLAAKRSFDGLEAARTAYETEDAIRRWAATAYLAADGDDPMIAGPMRYRSPRSELAYAAAAAERASAARRALDGLYAADSASMPYLDPAQEAAVQAYRDSYRKSLLSAKARDALGASAEAELRRRDAAYAAYAEGLKALGVGAPTAAVAAYLRVGGDGRLRLAYDEGFKIVGPSGEGELKAYFEDSSAFADCLDGLISWMAKRGFDAAAARRWGMARDHVLSKLCADDAAFAGAIAWRASPIDEGTLGGRRFALLGDTIAEMLADFRAGGLEEERRRAYEGMGAEERSWFDAYLALQLSGALGPPAPDGDDFAYDAFSYWSWRAEYEELERKAAEYKSAFETGIAASAASYAGLIVAAAAAGASIFLAWMVPGLLAAAGVAYAAMIGFAVSISGVQATQGTYAAAMGELVRQVDASVPYMGGGMADVAARKEAYLEACGRLARLSGGRDGSAWDAEALSSSLEATGSFTRGEILELTERYAAFASGLDEGAAPRDSYEAMARLARGDIAERDDALAAAERLYTEAAGAGRAAQDAYRYGYERYLVGLMGDEELAASAREAYGPEAASLRAYLGSLGGVLSEAASIASESGLDGEALEAATRLASLASLAAAARLDAASAARQAEWEVSRRELYDRREAWREAGGLILSRGRDDFARGLEAMRGREASWRAGFKGEYEAKSAAWDLGYADMLGDKLDWAARASRLADEAGAKAMLSLVGADAAAGARRLDAFRISPAELDDGAEGAYEEALAGAGIGAMAIALSAQAGSAGSMPAAVRLGLAGGADRDALAVRRAAAEFALANERRLAGAQARAMADRAREAAAAAMAALSASVDEANDGFNRAMNRFFIAGASWLRDGDSYRKDVVVHSTAVDPYIIERAAVAAFRRFVAAPWRLSVDLSDGALAGMDATGIRALVARAQMEVGAKAEEIFGGPRDESGGPEEAGGAFGLHLGREAVMADDPDPGRGEAGTLRDAGSGELGRLTAAFIYWSVRERIGWAQANKPFYEKDIWDDRGSWFQAPSIRGLADLGVSIAAGALSGGAALPALLGAAAMNLADDALFGALDLAGGYKGWEEAGLAFGKAALTQAANVATAGAFDGGLASGLKASGGALGNAALAGTRAAVSGLASSAIGAFYWDGQGLAWSADSFSAGARGALIGGAAGATGSLTSSALGRVNLYDGNGIALSGSIFDTQGIRSVNALAGGLAGQAMGYALGGDFSINLANFSMFGVAGADGRAIGGGLLELRLSRDGAVMRIGSGGVDASLAVLAASAGGLAEGLKIASAKASALAGGDRGLSTMNAVNMLGYSGDGFNEALGRALWSGRLEAEYGNSGGDWGRYDESDPARVLISDRLLGGGTEGAAKLAAALAHEGTHAAGNRYEYLAHRQGLATYVTLLGGFGLVGEAEFGAGMISALDQAASYDRNEGVIDRWRVRLDGSIMDDGDAGTVRFEDGRASLALGDGLGRQASLEKWLALAQGEGYAALIKASGARFVDGAWTQDLNIGRDVIEAAYRDGRLSEGQYRAIVGDRRGELDAARQEQAMSRQYRVELAKAARLADLVEAWKPTPMTLSYGSGAAGDPYLYAGQGALDQNEFYRRYGAYDEVGPCYLLTKAMPYLLMGASREDIYAALTNLPTGSVNPKDGEVYDAMAVWNSLQRQLGTPGVARYLGGYQQELSWDDFVASGAGMGELWIQHPNDPDREHWGLLYKKNETWYFQDPWNKSNGGVLDSWDSSSWDDLKTYKVRPIEVVLPVKP